MSRCTLDPAQSALLSLTGLSPSPAGFPKTFLLESLNQLCGPNPAVHAQRFGLFPFRSPLLWKSMVHHKRCCSFISLRFFRPVGDPDIDLAVLRELRVGRCALLEDRALLGIVGLFIRAAVAQAAALDARDSS